MRSSVASILFMLSFCVIGADASTLFDSDELLEVSINVDEKAISGNSATSLATSITDAATGLKTKGILSLRGNSRLSGCRPSPFRFKRTDTASKSTLLNANQTVYVVTHCFESTEGEGYAFETNVTREYLIYKIYEALNPIAIRTRLVKITYDNSKPHLALLMENISDVAKRHHLSVTENLYRGTDKSESWRKLRIFLAYVQDIDKDISTSKNAFLLKTKHNSVTAVPYDFDMTSLIGINDPTPNLSLDANYYDGMGNQKFATTTIRNVRDSLLNDPKFTNSLLEFKALEPKIVDLVTKLTPYLNPEWIRRFLRYTHEFMKPLPECEAKP
jgi:hypothetical protein